jgi:hypothetical protein
MPISAGFVISVLITEKPPAAKSWRKLDKTQDFLFIPRKFREEHLFEHPTRAFHP